MTFGGEYIHELQETPLFYAVREKSDDLVQLLLDYGADPSVVNLKGQTAFEAEEPKIPPHQTSTTLTTPTTPTTPTIGSETNTKSSTLLTPSPQLKLPQLRFPLSESEIEAITRELNADKGAETSTPSLKQQIPTGNFFLRVNLSLWLMYIETHFL
jgi:hypothetical protein